MEVTDRVHIVAHGWEVNRIVEPLLELKADKVVLIMPVNDAFVTDFEREMIERLEGMERIEVETRKANLYDMDSMLQVFTQAVKDHEGDDVFINVSTGTNVAGIAGMMAAQTSDAKPYFVKHQTAGEDGEEIQPPDEPLFPNAGPISELPVFELQGPSAEQLNILAYLYGKEGVTKKDLIKFAEEQELPFIADTEAKSDEGRYRLLESHIIDPLTDGGYVRVEKAGRKKHVVLEDRGVDALAAFPLDSDVIDSVESNQETPFEDVESLGGAGSIDFRDTISFKRKTDIDEN